MQPQTTPPKINKPDPRPEKVTQLQCGGLDQQFKSIFSSLLVSAFKYYPTFISRLKAQIELIIHSLYYRFTIWEDLTEPGNHLQNITYCTSELKGLTRVHKIGMLLLDIILPYLRKKFQGSDTNWLRKTTQYIDTAVKALQYINLVLFIKNGNFRTLTQRLLRIEMKFINPKVSRLLDFSLMNRQLLWTIYEAFLSAVLPFLKKTLNSNIKKIFYLYSYMDVNEQGQECMVCGEEQLTLPQSNNGCQHLACFYCMKVLTTGKEKFNCNVCGKEFTHWQSQSA